MSTAVFTNEQIDFFRKFLYENSGYNLIEGKEYLLDSRLKIVRDVHKLDNYQAIMDTLKMNPHSNIAIDTVEAMTVNETFFFRDDKPFEMFKDKIIPQLAEWSKNRPVRIWSAASSTGQEPYSIAIALEESKAKYPDLKYNIVASDINNRILAKARHGVYSSMEVGRGLTDHYLKKYFTADGDHWKINEDIRTRVTFFQQNLRKDFITHTGPFDLVFLRNVLIYFDVELKTQIVKKVSETMTEDGYMILGVSENIYDNTLDLTRENEMTGIYRKTSK